MNTTNHLAPPYRLLAIDVDGTLVNRHEELTRPTREALRRAGEAGIHVVLATGRRYSRVLHLVELLGLEVPLITASGALVKDPRNHQTIYRAHFHAPLLRRVLETIDADGYDPVLCADTYDEGFDYYHARDRVPSVELAEYYRLNSDCGRLRADLIENPPDGVFTGFAMGTRDEMLGLEQTLHRATPDRLYTHVLRSPRYTGFMCEFAPAGVTKWSAVRRLALAWNIPDHAICAVGDDVNDIPMIHSAGLGVAMGNALDEVKQAADRIAPSQADDGLVQVVEWLFET